MGDPATPWGAGAIPRPRPSPQQKLVVFTEHRDTLRYLHERITTLIGREGAVVVIHGGVGREQRLAAQEAFRNDPRVRVLLATDAAGEGINLQRAHLMVNYDLPWNPNRLEQRFGRIHRIGQTEVCHLWNLVADETREGDVYRRLLEKLEQARQALGGQVFDVLGRLEFEGRPLRELLLDAIRYGERREVRARLDTAVDQALDRGALQDLLEDRQLVHDALDASRVQRVRAELERTAQGYAVAHVVPEHLAEVRAARLALIAKTEATVKDRLTKEISYWDHRAEQLRLDEAAGKTGARLNSGEARRRADALQQRLRKRVADLKRDAQIAPRPPVVVGGLLVVPRGLLDALAGRAASSPQRVDTQASAARARALVMKAERRLEFEPTDRETEKLGYDIESRVPATGALRFIEVKGRRSDAETVTVTRNEILYSLNRPDDFILAIVEFRDDGAHRVHYVPRQPSNGPA